VFLGVLFYKEAEKWGDGWREGRDGIKRIFKVG
jgi:hypothetical protein